MKLPVLRSRRPATTEGDSASRPTAPWERLLRAPRPQNMRAIIQRNPGLKLVSLILAIFLWYSITKTERDAERMIDVPVSLRRIPDGLTVVNPPTKAVTVTLRGPRTMLDNVDDRRGRVQVPLNTIEMGENRIDLNGGMLAPELPRSLKVVRFDPPSLTLRADRRLMRRLPVKPDLAGSPPLGYTVVESTVEPEMVEVTGPARLVDELKQIRTEPIDLRLFQEPRGRNVLLERIDPTITFIPDVVRVRVVLEEVIATRDFPKVQVTAPEGVTQIHPATIDVQVRGPQRLLHNFKFEPGMVSVDVSGLTKGTHTVPVQVTMPEGLLVESRNPDKVRVKVGDAA
jgi:YbbR domain-containing protein